MLRRIYTPGHKIQRKTNTRNTLGGFIETWADLMTIEGYLRSLSGDERFAADKKTLFASHVFYTDPPITITQTDRYLDPSGKAYNIKNAPDKVAGNVAMSRLELELIE